jgi:arylsulfatase A-like enzyme
MKRTALAALGAVALVGCGGAPTPGPSATATPARRPNIVLILADDLDSRLGSTEVMSRMKELIADQGLTFRNASVTVSLCCPSRTTILRGQYSHNTQVFTNNGSGGGFEKVHALGLEASTVAVWLQAVGYRTALLGKYLNGYPENNRQRGFVPPGWDEWSVPNGGSPYSNFDYRMNENGADVSYGSSAQDYMTDVLSRKAVDFVRRSNGQPFFLYLATYAPHGPATPAPRHQGRFAGATAPRTPNFDEPDVGDKPDWVRTAARLTRNEIEGVDDLHRKRLESLLAVDELVAALIDALQAAGRLDDTYVFFTSDNGFHLGQHRQTRGKQAPYEEEVRVPLLVRGPGVPRGRTLEHLVGNVDLAPTFAALAGAPAPDFVDGRSLAPLLGASPPPASAWRQAVLIMHGEQDDDDDDRLSRLSPLLEPSDDRRSSALMPARGIPPFAGLRTTDFKYVEYTDGARELYDLRVDPYELQNLAGAEAALADRLSSWLSALGRCAGAGCRSLELAQR